MEINKRAALFLFLMLALVAFQLKGTEALAQSSYFTTNCAGCHPAPVVATCNGCHGHGTHPTSAKSTLNVAGVTNKSSYAPGETVTVTISGGYRTGWVRVALFDQNSVELARSTGNASGMGSSATLPATLTAPAPTTPGSYTWKVAWYGNKYDATGAAFGTGWVADATNPNHGYEIVNMAAFTVAAAADATPPTISSFTLPTNSNYMTVPVTNFNATDNVGVTGYCLTETNNAASCTSWPASAPANYTFAAYGAHTLYAFAKDAVGNTSLSSSAAVNVAPKADFNGNGKSEILWRNTSTGEVGIWNINGMTNTGYQAIGTAPLTWTLAGVGDFNGDGQPDILWRNTSTGEVGIWTMNGLTSTGYQAIGTTPLTWTLAGVGDFNADGKPDILWRNTSTGEVGVWIMNGMTSTGYQTIGTAPLTWTIAGVSDFNGDGKPDILWRNTSTGAVSIWAMNGIVFTGYSDAGQAALEWTLAGVGDCAGTGKPQLLWRNTTTGMVAVWTMNGNMSAGYTEVGTAPLAWTIAVH